MHRAVAVRKLQAMQIWDSYCLVYDQDQTFPYPAYLDIVTIDRASPIRISIQKLPLLSEICSQLLSVTFISFC